MLAGLDYTAILSQDYILITLGVLEPTTKKKELKIQSRSACQSARLFVYLLGHRMKAPDTWIDN